MVEITISQLEKMQSELKDVPKKIPIVTARAMNRSIEAARTEAARTTRKNYVIKHKDLIETIKIKRAYPGSLEANFSSSGSVLELMKFKVRANKPLPTHGKYAVVSVKKGSNKKINNSFVAKIYKETENVYTRVGSNRFPVRVHYGPSVPQMIGNEEVIAQVEKRAAEVLDQRLDHEISRVLGGSK